MSLHFRRRLVVTSLIALALTAAGPTVGNATDGRATDGRAMGGQWHGHPYRHPHLTVMTQNLYLGSSLNPALRATTPTELVAAVAQIYGAAVATNFPLRAEALADIIAVERPDLVGLQEVTNWIAQPLVAGANPPSFDFMTILQDALTARGLDYEVAAVSQNADIGPAPLVAPGFGCGQPSSPTTPQCVVRLQDRDVILVDDDTRGLSIRRASTGDYVAHQQFIPPGATAPISIDRGWAAVNATYRGVKFRFVTTHLEVEEFAAVQQAQAAEFLAGPARAHGRRPVIATGDFNSAADPATTSTPTTTYADLTASWFRDAWAVSGGETGFTCCQGSALANPVSGLSKRIDLVLTHGRAHASTAHVVADDPIGSTQPLWPSDHAGVVAVLRLHRPPGHRGP
jgi:endonuclease/exonuclease/phosphatase family metal-dependent hydrolase